MKIGSVELHPYFILFIAVGLILSFSYRFWVVYYYKKKFPAELGKARDILKTNRKFILVANIGGLIYIALALFLLGGTTFAKYKGIIMLPLLPLAYIYWEQIQTPLVQNQPKQITKIEIWFAIIMVVAVLIFVKILLAKNICFFPGNLCDFYNYEFP
ncbi:MAG: hypothetical protein AAB482_01100 [Patescibacteria group bacterium]